MTTMDTEHPLAVAAVEAIHTGDLPTLKRLLAEHPDLATDDAPIRCWAVVIVVPARPRPLVQETEHRGRG